MFFNRHLNVFQTLSTQSLGTEQYNKYIILIKGSPFLSFKILELDGFFFY